jgi:hypothetical protein
VPTAVRPVRLEDTTGLQRAARVAGPIGLAERLERARLGVSVRKVYRSGTPGSFHDWGGHTRVLGGCGLYQRGIGG